MSQPSKRILSGLQPSGQLHIGNYCGAIQQFLALQEDPATELFIFVASYHAMTNQRSADELREATRQVVIDYLAFGLDPAKGVHIYLQQDLPQVTELAWLLACQCPNHLMDKAVSYKDKLAKGLKPNIGLYTYPILQAADILIVDADVVPVGRDQVQHIEITRDLAQKINSRFGSEDTPVLKLPDYRVREDAAVVPGIDGEKMSKSYGNTIDPFMDEKPLRKRIMKIKTDATPIDQPKDADNCPVFQIFSALAGADDARTADLRHKYENPAGDTFGYGHAKQALFELILDIFGPARARRAELMADPTQVDAVLQSGAAAANAVANDAMQRVRTAMGLR